MAYREFLRNYCRRPLPAAGKGLEIDEAVDLSSRRCRLGPQEYFATTACAFEPIDHLISGRRP